MAMTFNDFVQIELPKRPFTETDGAPGQVLVRSNRPERPRELVWTTLTGLEAAFSLPAAIALSGHRAIQVQTDGTAIYAEPESAWAYVGISTHSAEAGAQVTVALRDTITELTWSWVPGKPVYYGPSGILTQTVPDAVALTCIGLAITPTSLLIQRDTPVFLLGA